MKRLAWPCTALAAAALGYVAGKEDGRAALMRADVEFAKAAQARRLEGWMSYFADDATIFPPGQDLLTGKDKLREHYAKMWGDPDFNLEWKPVMADIARSGDLGYTIGKATIRYRDKDGKAAERPGKYLTVWKRQRDGTYKVVADVGN